VENDFFFEFDHRDVMTKIANISALSSKGDDVFYAELAKCRLLCVKCHRENTRRQWQSGEIAQKINFRKRAREEEEQQQQQHEIEYQSPLKCARIANAPKMTISDRVVGESPPPTMVPVPVRNLPSDAETTSSAMCFTIPPSTPNLPITRTIHSIANVAPNVIPVPSRPPVSLPPIQQSRLSSDPIPPVTKWQVLYF